MKLETYAEKHGIEVADYTGLLPEHTGRGWTRLAVFPDANIADPAMTLLRSPRWPNWQVCNIWGPFRTGQMVTDAQIKAWIKETHNKP